MVIRDSGVNYLCVKVAAGSLKKLKHSSRTTYGFQIAGFGLFLWQCFPMGHILLYVIMSGLPKSSSTYSNIQVSSCCCLWFKLYLCGFQGEMAKLSKVKQGPLSILADVVVFCIAFAYRGARINLGDLSDRKHQIDLLGTFVIGFQGSVSAKSGQPGFQPSRG